MEDAPRKRGRQPMESQARRQQLLQAATQVFLRKGFHATRIEDIVAEAKTGKGTFYLAFDHKEEVFEALLDDFFSEIQATLAWVKQRLDSPEGAEPGGGGLSLETLFQEEAARIFQTLMDHRDVATLLMREGRGAGTSVEERIVRFYREMVGVSKNTLSAAGNLGLLPPFHAEIAALCIVGAIEKVYEFWLRGELKEVQPTIVRETLAFLLRGCGLPSDLSRLGASGVSG